MLGLDKIQLIIGAVIVALLTGLGVKAYHDIKESGRQEIREQWKASALKEAEQGRQAVAKAIADAKAEIATEEEQRKNNEQIERAAQQKQAEDAAKNIRDLDRRYRAALIHNASCAKQDMEIVQCPLE